MNKLYYQDIVTFCLSDIKNIVLYGFPKDMNIKTSREIVDLADFKDPEEYINKAALGLLYYDIPVKWFYFENEKFQITLEKDFGIDIDNKFLAAFKAARSLYKSNQTAVAAAVLMEFEKQNNVSLNKEIIMNFFNEH